MLTSIPRMFRRSYPDIEVRAEAVNVFISAFELFPSIGQKYLSRNGIGGGRLLPEKAGIPLDLWLDMFDAVMKDVGPNALYKIGQNCVKNPNFPPSVRDLEAALREINVAYHMSHRKGGVVMLDRRGGKMLEGIGHYTVTRSGSQKTIELTSDTPYPCPAEQGLVSGLATLFEPLVSVSHSLGSCRMNGEARCVYVVSW